MFNIVLSLWPRNIEPFNFSFYVISLLFKDTLILYFKKNYSSALTYFFYGKDVVARDAFKLELGNCIIFPI